MQTRPNAELLAAEPEQYATMIQQQAQAILDNEAGEQPDWPEIEEMLENWEYNRPAMWARLEPLGISRELAIVLQNRYWQARDQYRQAGMPWPDARAEAMKEWLLLGPGPEEMEDEEDEVEEGSLAELMQLLQQSKALRERLADEREDRRAAKR